MEGLFNGHPSLKTSYTNILQIILSKIRTKIQEEAKEIWDAPVQGRRRYLPDQLKG